MTRMTIETIKGNDNHRLPPMISETGKVSDRVCLPLPPTDSENSPDTALYMCFMRHLRVVPTSRLEIKILHALQFTADVMGVDIVDATAMLVQCGLRAPRLAFPAIFLEMADAALMREDKDIGAANTSLIALRGHWDGLGEDRWAGVTRPHVMRQAPSWVIEAIR